MIYYLLLADVHSSCYFLVANLDKFPIGTIIPWINKVEKDGVLVDFPVAEGWHKCDGTTIPSGSIWAGKTTPDLNGEMRFLRGAPESSVLETEEDQLQDHKHKFHDPGHIHKYTYRHKHNRPDAAPGATHPIDQLESEVLNNEATTSTSTGITITEVEDTYRTGSETRPKNMHVIYIMKVK